MLVLHLLGGEHGLVVHDAPEYEDDDGDDGDDGDDDGDDGDDDLVEEGREWANGS